MDDEREDEVASRLTQLVAVPSADPTPADADFWANVWKWFLGVPLQILIIVAITTVTIVVLHRLINKTVEKLVVSAAKREDPAGEGAAHRRASNTSDLSDILLSQRRAQRAHAIGSLLRSVVTAIAAGIGLLMILPMLGINVGPLLASAGVLGVALGFGAQNLIKDYLSGIFIVLEDQYGVGDLVDLGSVVGTVEEVTLRVTRLRDQTGVVWYVRNGEILTVANRSQGWTLAIADIPVAATTNLELVRATVNQVAEQMMADHSLDESLLDTPRYVGVESVSGEAIFIRVVAKVAPEQQLTVSRTMRERLKVAFDDADITIPVVTRLPGQTPGTGGGTPGAGSPGGGGAGGSRPR
ncbi:MAG: Mechanosensitive ion channel family protein [Actinomycetota bacterium]|nr:Mechanosensitive ion channel family protein [Actinomycetota bacterium]